MIYARYVFKYDSPDWGMGAHSRVDLSKNHPGVPARHGHPDFFCKIMRGASKNQVLNELLLACGYRQDPMLENAVEQLRSQPLTEMVGIEWRYENCPPIKN